MSTAKRILLPLSAIRLLTTSLRSGVNAMPDRGSFRLGLDFIEYAFGFRHQSNVMRYEYRLDIASVKIHYS